MGNTFGLPIIRLIQRLSMVLTLCCVAYVIFFLFSKNQDNSVSDNNVVVPTKATGLMASAPTFDLKPMDMSDNPQVRDIFSLTAATSPVATVDTTPKGQLPDHFKVVGILVSKPSQIIIQDSVANSTYFIDEDHPQAGIKIVSVSDGQMIINYQGQNIPVPISKN